MPRCVIKKAHGPFELTRQETSKWICMCGLSKNQPFCDSSHKRTLDEDEDTVYAYDTAGGRKQCTGDCLCTRSSK